MTQRAAFRTDENILYITLSERIDAANAGPVEKDIQAVRKAHQGFSTVLDAEMLSYISSAGLRILLRLRKEEPELTIINVSPGVYEILDMTGFTEIMTVKKAYRRLSVDGCEMIGKGANGAVYRYDEETIIKVYFNPDALAEIQRERELSRKALVLGINTAIPYDVVRIGKSYGTVMELLEASSLSQLIKKDPDHLELPLRYYVDMLKHIHSTEVSPGSMPDMKKAVLEWAEFDREYLHEGMGGKLYKMVEDVPEQHTMLHGDYHTNNILIRDGEALLIDMDTLCMGHPIFELGSIFNAFVGFYDIDHDDIQDFLGISYEMGGIFWRRALAMYLGTEEPEKLDEVENKAKVIGYMRLLRRTIRRSEPKREQLIAHYREQLESLLRIVEKLTF